MNWIRWSSQRRIWVKRHWFWNLNSSAEQEVALKTGAADVPSSGLHPPRSAPWKPLSSPSENVSDLVASLYNYIDLPSEALWQITCARVCSHPAIHQSAAHCTFQHCAKWLEGSLFVLFDVRYLMTKVSPPRLTLPFSTSVCHSADNDIQNWYESSSGVQGCIQEIPSVKTRFCKRQKPQGILRQDSGMCLCMLFLVILSWLRKGCGHKGIWCQSRGGGSQWTVQRCCVSLWGEGLVWCVSVGCCLCPGGLWLWWRDPPSLCQGSFTTSS